MDCCSPDVGDCQKCHPEMWIQKGSSYTSWISKEFSKRVKSPRPFNRTRSKPFRPRARTQKKRIV